MSSAAVPFSCGCDDAATPGVSWWRILVSAFLAVNSMALAIAVNTSDTDRIERLALQSITLGATAIVTALLGWPLAVASFQALRARRITIEALFLLSYLGAACASLLSMLTGHGPVYWEVAGILLVVYSLGTAVGRYSQQCVLKTLAAWDPLINDCDRVRADGAVETVAIANVEAGDLIRVHPGCGIPVDGVVENGRAFVRESEMTGEAFAAARVEGNRVFAGTSVLDATLDIRATAGGKLRQVDRISAALTGLHLRPAPSQILADRIMRWFVPALVAIAAGTFAFWYFRAGFAAALFNSMAVLLVACPCALGFATPVSVWSGMGRLAAIGLTAKNGATIEKIAALDTLVFDKTGTLTIAGLYRAELSMLPDSPIDETDLRTLIACAEARSQHPVAAALSGLAETDERVRVERIEILPAVGIRAQLVDRSGVMVQLAIGMAPAPDPADESHHLVVKINGIPAALVALTEEISPGVEATMTALERDGIHCVLMTGDTAGRASRIPIPERHAALTPDDKLRLCRELSRERKNIAFIGDGLNDAAAMSASGVSVAVDSGAALAREVADVIWTRSDIGLLPRAIAICRQTVKSMRTTIAIALAYNAVGIALAAAGLLHPVVASILMTCSSVIVTWRSVSVP